MANIVLEGDYKGKAFAFVNGFRGEKLYLVIGLTQKILIDKDSIESYEVITEEHRKSAVSGVSRGLVGGALLGPVGLLAGLSAKNKGTYNIVIQFKDGKRSLVEVNSKVYKYLIKVLF